VPTKKQKCKKEYKNKQCVFAEYSNPVRGGAFNIPASMMDKHIFLLSFVELKAQACVLLNDLNIIRSQKNRPLIQPEAVRNEIVLLDSCVATADVGKNKCLYRVLKVYTGDNKHTLVCHHWGITKMCSTKKNQDWRTKLASASLVWMEMAMVVEVEMNLCLLCLTGPMNPLAEFAGGTLPSMVILV
jgi:hypothetical protein